MKSILHDPSGHYSILGLQSNDVTPKEVKKAFFEKAKLHHPDKNQKKIELGQMIPESTNVMSLINKAYEILKDPVKKSLYDSRSERRYIRLQYDGMSIPSEYHRNDFRSGAPPLPCKQRLELSLFEAHSGCCKSIEITKDVICKKCNGSGAKTEEVNLEKMLKCERCNGSGHLIIFEKKPDASWTEGSFEQKRKRMRTVKDRSTQEFRDELARAQKDALFMICPDCNGNGRVLPPSDMCIECIGRGTKREKVTLNNVKIPPARDNKFEHILDGLGNEAWGHEPSQVILQISVKPSALKSAKIGTSTEDAMYHMIGSEIFVDIDVPVKHLFGEEEFIRIPALEGNNKELDVPIPRGGVISTQKFKGRGMLQEEGEKRGDLNVSMVLIMPCLNGKKRKSIYLDLTNYS